MSWVTVIWSMAAACCLTLAGQHLMVGVYSRKVRSELLFVAAATAAAFLALLEINMMRAQSAAEYAEILRWMHLPAAVIVIAIVWFVRFFLGAGRLWLAWSVTVLRLLIQPINFIFYPNATFAEITSLGQVEFWGETFSVPVGEPNPWRWLIHLSMLLFVIYLLDVIVTLWRRGSRRRALVFGGGIILALLLSAIFSHLMVRGMLPAAFITLVFLILVMAMSFELSLNLLHAGKIARELRDSKQRMGLAIEAASLNIWEWNLPENDIKVLGTTRNKGEWQMNSLGRFEEYLDIVHPADRESTRRAIGAAADSGGSFETEFRIVEPDGETRWISARGEAQLDENGKPLLVRGVSRDITLQKNAEIEAQERRAELAHAARVSALGQLSTALAHEISQPLGAILRNSEAAEMYLAQDPPDLDELKEIILDIRRDDQRAAAIVERMRALLKRRELELIPLDLGELVEQTASVIKTEIQAAQIDLRLEIPADLPQVRGDRVHLQQVLINLLLNSLEALIDTPGGQITLQASKSGDGMVELAVIDNGAGFQKQHLARLFEPFFTTRTKGTGIGLAISKTIVELHGGSIIAENDPNGGAAVRFTLQEAGCSNST